MTDFWPESAVSFDSTYKKQVLGLVQERLKFFKELPLLTEFFFKEPSDDAVKTLMNDVKNKQLKKLSSADKQAMLVRIFESLEESDFSVSGLETCLN